MSPNIKIAAQILITTELMIMFAWMLHTLVSQTNMTQPVRDVFVIVLYQVVPLVTGAVGFWMGTSLSSAAKDHHISKSTEKTNA
jgi:hypothetical protein